MSAPPPLVWSLVSDVTRMGEWSPETHSAAWIKGAAGPAPGAKFRGANRHGKRSWKTVSTVLESVRGRRFSFRVDAGPLAISEWAYEIEETATGCSVTETWTDRRGRLAMTISKPASGVADRASHNRIGMEQTLERLADAAETLSA